MSVLVDGRFLSRPAGGLQRAATGLLTALRAEGVDLEVVAPFAHPLVDTVARPASALRWTQVTLPRLARGRLVLCLTNTAPLRGRTAVWVHDLAPLVGPQWFRPSMRLYGRWVLAGAARAEVLLTPSYVVADELGARGAQVSGVVANALDDVFSPAGPAEVAALRTRWGLERPYVLLPGWADPRKGADVALHAHRAVRDRQPHDLVLTGSRRRVFARTETPGDPSVRVLDHVTDEDYRVLLTGATALLYPSLYEGFGLPPHEARAVGTPALVSDLPVLREADPLAWAWLPVGERTAWTLALERVLAEQPRQEPSRSARSWSDASQELLALLPGP